MLRSYYSYTNSLSSTTWHPGPVPIPVPMVPVPMVPYPYPWLCHMSYPYPYPYPWPRTRTRTTYPWSVPTLLVWISHNKHVFAVLALICVKKDNPFSSTGGALKKKIVPKCWFQQNRVVRTIRNVELFWKKKRRKERKKNTGFFKHHF